MLNTLAIFLLYFGVGLHGLDAGRYPKSDAQESRKPAHATPQTVIPQSENSPDLRGHSKQEQGQYQPPSVKIIPPPKDIYDKWSFGVSLALALAGIAGVIAAFCTLSTIRKQTKATFKAAEAASKSADAALKNAQWLLNTERPWMLLEITHRKDTEATFSVTFKNYGRTPAEVLGFSKSLVKGKPKFTDPPEYPDGTLTSLDAQMVGPDMAWVHSDRIISMTDSFAPQDWQSINKGEREAFYLGRLIYRDLIEIPSTVHLPGPQGGTWHETCFCYRYFPSLTMFLPEGPMAYRKHT